MTQIYFCQRANQGQVSSVSILPNKVIWSVCDSAYCLYYELTAHHHRTHTVTVNYQGKIESRLHYITKKSYPKWKTVCLITSIWFSPPRRNAHTYVVVGWVSQTEQEPATLRKAVACPTRGNFIRPPRHAMIYKNQCQRKAANVRPSSPSDKTSAIWNHRGRHGSACRDRIW